MCFSLGLELVESGPGSGVLALGTRAGHLFRFGRGDCLRCGTVVVGFVLWWWRPTRLQILDDTGLDTLKLSKSCTEIDTELSDFLCELRTHFGCGVIWRIEGALHACS